MAQMEKFFVTFMLINTLSGIIRGATIFVVNLYAIHLGANLVELGLVRGISGLSILLSVLPIGFFVDYLGAKKIYIFGELLGALLNLSLIFITTPGELIFRSALIGIAMALRFTSLQAVFLERLNTIGSDKAGWFRGSGFLGVMLLGPVFGTYLIKHLSYQMIFIFTAVLMLFIAGITYIFLNDLRECVKKPSLKINSLNIIYLKKQFAILLRNKILISAMVFEGLNSACFSVFSIFILIIALKIFDFTPNLAGHLISLGGLGFVSAILWGGILFVKSDYKNGIPLSFTITVLGLILLATAHTNIQLWIGSIILGLSMGLTNLITITQISNIEGKKGKLSGVFSVSSSIGHTFGPILGGFIGKVFGPQTVFLFFIPFFIIFGLRTYLITESLEVQNESFRNNKIRDK